MERGSYDRFYHKFPLMERCPKGLFLGFTIRFKVYNRG
jgi:hypothetical protein